LVPLDLVKVYLFATVLDGLNIPLPAGTHGLSLLPYISYADEGALIRRTSVFGRYGETMNITAGEWTLYGWSPIEKNEPLNWYSPLPPQYGDMRVNDDFDGQRYSTLVTRGPMSSALNNIKDDPQQERNRYTECPEIVERLKSSLCEFLTSINAHANNLLD
jgi:hypothetical protein